MTSLRFSCLIPLLFCACSHQPTSPNAVSTLFCDRYLFYRMCAVDVSQNGRTDFIYFEDSREIFLFDQKKLSLVPTDLTLHTCAQSMDEPLLDATALLLTVNDEMSFFQRSEIKNKIFYHYMRYVPRINRCKRADVDTNNDNFLPEEDDFGMKENQELGL